LFNLAALILDFALLGLQLRLSLRVLIVLILHIVAYRKPASRTDRAADRRTRSWRPDRRADYRSGSRAHQCPDSSALLAG
jgi:hypothetical protein